MLRDIFYFSKADRRALAILSVLILVLLSIRYFTDPQQVTGNGAYAQVVADSTFSAKIDSAEQITVQKSKLNTRFQKNNKFKTRQLIDLNTADTTLLQRIPGIGHGFSLSIIILRDKLGGFASPAQLSEISHFPDSLQSWFFATPDSIRKIRINRASVYDMKRHPYISFYQAKAIDDLRKKEGKIKDPARLLLLKEFTQQDLVRLAPYISYE